MSLHLNLLFLDNQKYSLASGLAETASRSRNRSKTLIKHESEGKIHQEITNFLGLGINPNSPQGVRLMKMVTTLSLIALRTVQIVGRSLDTNLVLRWIFT